VLGRRKPTHPEEAESLLRRRVEELRALQYAELEALAGYGARTAGTRGDSRPVIEWVTGASGTTYQFEIQVFNDGRGTDLRTVVSLLEDGRARQTISAGFIRASDGGFVDE
jgi:hypothetical protein